MTYGILSYDVPVKDHSTYVAVRKRLRGRALPITMSAYLVPWMEKKSIEDALTALQAKSNIRFSVLKFDDSENEKLDKMAHDALCTFLQASRKFLLKKMDEFKVAVEMGVEDIDEAKRSISGARKKMEEAKSLALLFLVTDKFEDMFKVFQTLVDGQAELLRATAQVKPSAVVDDAPQA